MAEVVLKEIGSNKVQVIKVYREVTKMGLKEAKEAIDSVEGGTPEKIDVDSDLVSSVIAQFNEAGANAVAADSGADHPETDSSGSFRMVVEDVFAITGKGVVATGCISSGLIKLYSQVQICHNDGSSIISTVTGIEKSKHMVETAKSGENVGLLLSGLNRGQIAAGDVIDDKNSVTEGRKFTEEKPLLGTVPPEKNTEVKKVTEEKSMPETVPSEKNTEVRKFTEEKSMPETVPPEKNTNVIVNTVNLPTSSPQNREETLNMLYEVGRIAESSESLAEQIISIRTDIDSKKSKAEELKHVVSSKAKAIKWIAILCSLLTCTFLSIFGIAVAIVVWLVVEATVIQKDLEEHEAENNANAERYIAGYVRPLERRLEEVQAELAQLNASGQIEWAKDIVGEDMFYSVCIGDLYDFVKSRRADSLKEALNLYDDVQYKARMEERQAAIQNASEAAAAEAAKQTEYSREIAKSSYQAAKAAKKSAYHTKQISKNTRQISKNTRRFR